MSAGASFRSLRLSTNVWRTARGTVRCKSALRSDSTAEMPNISGEKRPLRSESKARQSTKRLRKRDARDGPTTEDVLHADILGLLKDAGLEDCEVAFTVPDQKETDVTITRLSSTGEGLGRTGEDSSQVFVIPFSIPGDTVRAKAWKTVTEPVPYTLADFIHVVKPSQDRNESFVRCRYFGKCSGCQFQMLSYEKQLENKKNIIEKAFRHFSHLPPELVPAVEDVHGSPLQYGFRTKLNPHFETPRGTPRRRKKPLTPIFDTVPPIGFQLRSKPGILDIEECPVGSDVLQLGLKRERQHVTDKLKTYTNGATILLRESTRRTLRKPEDAKPGIVKSDKDTHTIWEYHETFVDTKSCISDNGAITTEYIDDFKFSNPAGSFFQNNNSILPSFIDYIRQLIESPQGTAGRGPYINLVDAYCGSGLFSITLASLFKRTIGIDIDQHAVQSAERNVRDNATLIPPAQRVPSSTVDLVDEHEGLPLSANDHTPTLTSTNNRGVHFIAADAKSLFDSVKEFKPEETVVILDPPRKGCDQGFLTQLLDYAPDRIVYISCNVHSQARDLGLLLRNMAKHDEGKHDYGQRLYDVESLTGFDFFPQTTHVEGIAVLSKRRGLNSGDSVPADETVAERPEGTVIA